GQPLRDHAIDAGAGLGVELHEREPHEVVAVDPLSAGQHGLESHALALEPQVERGGLPVAGGAGASDRHAVAAEIDAAALDHVARGVDDRLTIDRDPKRAPSIPDDAHPDPARSVSVFRTP